MISNRARAVARVVGGLAMLALVALAWAGCSSAPASEGVGTEESAIRCNQDDCTGNPPGRTPCGVLDNACCAGSACHDGSVCDDTNTCATTCGGASFPCCAGNTCANGVACVNGTCGACGAQNQQCCSNVGCNAGLTCQGGACKPPPICGHNGEARCNGRSCTAGTCRWSWDACGSDNHCHHT